MAEREKDHLVEIVGDAMQLAPTEREAFVLRACENEAERIEAISLLAAMERAGGFMDRPTLDRRGLDEAALSERPGTMVGRYRLLRQLGEGGFGVVFLAEQRDPVRREVALKVIKLGMDTRAVIARFEAERQALAMMDHPNIAKVLDAGATEAGRPYFVMDLVRGQPITKHCDSGGLTIPERLDLFTQVCRAVQHAHAKGIIHRDIKPSNVLVGTQDGRPIVRVIDFGIAKATNHRLTEKTLFTAERQMIGTPEYMSPEQAGAGFDIDTRTDVYSLGVLLYELLTGATPFDAARLRSAAFGEIQRIIREDEPPAPSTRLSRSTDTLAGVAASRRVEPRKLGAILRGELDWIVMRAMEKDRLRRYESAGNLAADVERYLGGQAIEAAPPSTRYRMRKFVRRNRGTVVAISLVAAALVLGTVGTAIGLLRANAARDDEQRQRELAQKNEKVAQSVSLFIRDMLAKANRGQQQGNPDVRVREVMDAAAANLRDGKSSYEPEVESAIARTIGGIYRELSLMDEAEAMMRHAAEKQRALHGDRSLEHGAALNDLGELQKIRGKLDEADALYTRADEIFRAANAEETIAFAELTSNRGTWLMTKYRVDEAEALFRRAAETCERLGATENPSYLNMLNNLAGVALNRKQYAEAESALRRVLAIEKRRDGEESPSVLHTMHNLGVVLQYKGDEKATLGMFQDELALARKLNGDGHVSVASALQSLGVLLYSRGDFAGAEAALREGTEIKRKVMGAKSSEFVGIASWLAGALLRLERWEEAAETYREAYEASLAVYGEKHNETAFAGIILAQLMARSGNIAEAEGLARRCEGAMREVVTPGKRNEWNIPFAGSILGEVVFLKKGHPSESPEQRSARLLMAESLLVPAATRLIALGEGVPKSRRELVLREAKDRVVRLYEEWDAAEPGSGKAALADEWKRK